MFTANLEEIRFNRQERERQAAHQRLIRSLSSRAAAPSRLRCLIAEILITAGNQLKRPSRTIYRIPESTIRS